MVERPAQPSDIRVETVIRIRTRPEQPGMVISVTEWDQLVGRVESCKVSLQPWSVAYSVAFGVGVTAGLSIAPIAFSRLPWWILTIYVVFGALGLFSGIIFFVAEKALARRQQSQIDQLISDMNHTKASFTPPSN